MPALLLKGLEILHTLGEEYSIQIYINQVIEILNVQ